MEPTDNQGFAGLMLSYCRETCRWTSGAQSTKQRSVLLEAWSWRGEDADDEDSSSYLLRARFDQ